MVMTIIYNLHVCYTHKYHSLASHKCFGIILVAGVFGRFLSTALSLHFIRVFSIYPYWKELVYEENRSVWIMRLGVYTYEWNDLSHRSTNPLPRLIGFSDKPNLCMRQLNDKTWIIVHNTEHRKLTKYTQLATNTTQWN